MKFGILWDQNELQVPSFLYISEKQNKNLGKTVYLTQK